ncbi:MAG: hypothetical protein WC914_08105 [Proteiniphilum sp.]
MVNTSHQYPQGLFKKTITPSQQLPNGSWTEETEAWQAVSACREETNGRGTMINTADGRAIAFSSLIQAPKGTPRVDEGTEVIISTDAQLDVTKLLNADFVTTAKQQGIIVAQGTCLKCDSGRLHTRIWI